MGFGMLTILYVNAVGGMSGAERSLLALLDARDDTQWQAVVAAPEGALLQAVRARGVPAVPVPLAPLRRPRSLGAAWRTWQAVRDGRRALRRILHMVQPDLLHANTTSAMLFCPPAPTMPLIWHVRDMTPAFDVWGRQLYRRAARVAVISQAVRDVVLPWADDGGAKILCVSPAVDDRHFSPAPESATVRAALGLPAELPLLGLVAQCVPWKRHHLFLDMLELLADRPWHAVIAGAELGVDPAYRRALAARLAHPPFTGRVTWVPWQEDAAPLLAALDILVLPSDHEPFGRVLIEAMACAVPVVAVAEGGPLEIICNGTTGLLAPPTAPALATAVARLLDDPALAAALGAAGRADVHARFSLAQQRSTLTTLYTELLRPT